MTGGERIFRSQSWDWQGYLVASAAAGRRGKRSTGQRAVYKQVCACPRLVRALRIRRDPGSREA